MQTITLGESGLECSRLVYGCWRVTGVIHHHPICQEHEKKSHKSIKAARDYCTGAPSPSEARERLLTLLAVLFELSLIHI
mgnify:CR=1 FL=1